MDGRGRASLLALCGLAGLALSASNSSSVAPLSIPPSGFWDGDDGFWSTFQIQVGTPGQTVRLLPGTSASAGTTIWVVVPQGCSEANPGLANCANERGYVFRSNSSISWSTQGLATGPSGAVFQLNTFEEQLLGLTGNGLYGYDTINLGIPGSGLPTLQHQVIAGIAADDFWLGSLGLSPVPFNFTNLDEPQPSMMGSLRNQSLIPSSTWAYTAGAHYRSATGPSFGSLTLGGFDTTRFRPNDLDFSFGADFSRDLVVHLESITYDTVGSSPLLANGIDIFIDSLVTEIWLPVEVCRAFEQQFKLTWNSTAQLYIIDNDVHEALLSQNPTFTFTIGLPGGGGDAGAGTVDIVLPYAAFDLNLTQPIVNTESRYFPLKQAQNFTQYTLGRTFLQEAYVIADYDRRNFSVSQALFPSSSVSQNIVPINPPDSDEKGGGDDGGGGGLSGGAIAGIVVGVIAIMAILAAAALWTVRRRRRGVKLSELEATELERREKRGQAHEAHYTPLHEVDGEASGLREMDGHDRNKTSELQAFQSAHLGRHELGSEAKVHEMAGPEVPPVELEAPIK